MLLLCALFLRLGVWQWHRAAFKRSLLAAYAAQAARPPVSLNGLLQDSTLESFPRYLRVQAVGSYDGSRQILLEDMTHEGAVGYEVLTPFALGDGHLILVDRGWLAAAADRKAPDVTVPGGGREVRGVLGELPEPGLRLGKSAPPAPGWPKTLFYPQAPDVTALYGDKLLTPILKLDPAEPDGYLREYTPDVGLPPERHLGYAFQWVAMALAVFAVWLVVNLRRGKRSAETKA
jgi:cytochrome oxidase assembly protein ShyY1